MTPVESVALQPAAEVTSTKYFPVCPAWALSRVKPGAVLVKPLGPVHAYFSPLAAETNTFAPLHTGLLLEAEGTGVGLTVMLITFELTLQTALPIFSCWD